MMIGKELLFKILCDWSYWGKKLPLSIPRKVLNSNISLHPDIVWAIQGIRRCGKSTLLVQIMEKYGLDPNHCFFMNFEDPRVSDVLDSTLLDEIVSLAKSKQENDQSQYFFFDEIQNVRNWEKWFHSKLERPDHAIFIITGSNAALLSGELSTTLTGRHLTIELFPFDFDEYRLLKSGKGFDSFLFEGGFPRVLTFDQPERLLREYFSDVIERDVRRRLSIRSTLALSRLVKTIFESTGSEISQRSLSRTLGVTPDTIGTYLEACEKAYVVLQCPYFTFSEKQRASRNRKYYPIDLGLRNAVITKGGKDLGKSLETVVFHHLKRKFGNVFYWRGDKEVDFVVLEGTEIFPIQVSWEGKKDRHEKALVSFYKEYPQAKEAVQISRHNVEDYLVSLN